MRERARELVIWICLWVLSQVLADGPITLDGAAEAVKPIRQRLNLTDRAFALTQAQDAYPDRSGEAKRHQVYAQLVKEFPEVNKRAVSRAIERSLEDA